jgi:hypothetical protein
MKKSKSIELLKNNGIVNPNRLVQLIKNSIRQFELDLKGLTVLTEAASGPFVITSVLAALAGAEKVLALTGESKYASSENVIKQTRALEDVCDVNNNVEIITERSNDLFAQADIVTNLGFVRPIDNDAIRAMKTTGVISIMCEPWEVRKDDIDMQVCKDKNILVAGTNEDALGLKVFDYVKPLILKMLLEAGLEVYQNNYLIISEDKFGERICDSLRRNGANVIHNGFNNISSTLNYPKRLDGIIVADYTCERTIIGKNGILKPEDILNYQPSATVIQFAGIVKIDELKHFLIQYYPDYYVGSNKMGKTFSFLGVKPVIDLHAAGIKVGEILYKRNSDSRFMELVHGISAKI